MESVKYPGGSSDWEAEAMTPEEVIDAMQRASVDTPHPLTQYLLDRVRVIRREGAEQTERRKAAKAKRRKANRAARRARARNR